MGSLGDAGLSHKITVLREILRNNEIIIIQFVVKHGDSKDVLKSDIVDHLKNNLDELDVAYHLARLEKFKILQAITKEVEGKLETFYCFHAKIEDFVVD